MITEILLGVIVVLLLWERIENSLQLRVWRKQIGRAIWHKLDRWTR